jgi:hypothetical protein
MGAGLLGLTTMTPQLEELVTHLRGLSDEELRELAATPEWALFMHRLWKIRPGDELTLERVEMEARVCREYPCSTEFYKAQVELARNRARFLSQKGVITVGSVMASDLVPQRHSTRHPPPAG